MRSTTDWDLQDGKKIARPQDSQEPNNTGTMAAAAVILPRANAFPQPPVGAFDLCNSGPGWNNNDMINVQNWNQMMRRCRPPYEHQRIFEFTSSPAFRDNYDHFRRTTATIMSGITQPNENDVLMGRGGKNNQFIGNERLRVIARQRCQEYKDATKKGKSQISRELVDAVRRKNPPGRFLKKNPTNNTWEDVGDETAREKTSQVLRDAINSVKTFSNDPPLKKDATPPLTTRELSVAVTHEKSASFQNPVSSHGGMKRTSSSDSRGSYPVYGWQNDYSMSPAMQYRPYGQPFRQASGTYFRPSSAYMHHQYPVTPSSSTILPPSAAKKRPRIQEESPLIPGYHRSITDIETPKESRGTASAHGTPNMSLMYASPPNPRKQGFSQTPPAITYKSMMPPSLDNPKLARPYSDKKPPASASGKVDASLPSPSVSQSRTILERATAGQPSGESSDCWINDLHQFQPLSTSEHFKPPSRRQSMNGSVFDPFNDDLLSDSEQCPEGTTGSMSPFPFFYPKRDSI